MSSIEKKLQNVGINYSLDSTTGVILLTFADRALAYDGIMATKVEIHPKDKDTIDRLVLHAFTGRKKEVLFLGTINEFYEQCIELYPEQHIH